MQQRRCWVFFLSFFSCFNFNFSTSIEPKLSQVCYCMHYVGTHQSEDAGLWQLPKAHPACNVTCDNCLPTVHPFESQIARKEKMIDIKLNYVLFYRPFAYMTSQAKTMPDWGQRKTYRWLRVICAAHTRVFPLFGVSDSGQCKESTSTIENNGAHRLKHAPLSKHGGNPLAKWPNQDLSKVIIMTSNELGQQSWNQINKIIDIHLKYCIVIPQILLQK